MSSSLSAVVRAFLTALSTSAIACGSSSASPPGDAPPPSTDGGSDAGTDSPAVAAHDAAAHDAAAPDAKSPSDATTTDPCNACVAVRCASQEAACAADAACLALVQCFAACTDAACIHDCANANAAGLDTARPLFDCEKSSCPTPCGVSADAGPPPKPGSTGDRCAINSECATQTCATDQNADDGSVAWCTRNGCVTDADCDGYGPGGANSYGRSNLCFHRTDGTASCFPTCAHQSECDVYSPPGKPGATCLRHSNGQTFCDYSSSGVPVP